MIKRVITIRVTIPVRPSWEILKCTDATMDRFVKNIEDTAYNYGGTCELLGDESK